VKRFLLVLAAGAVATCFAGPAAAGVPPTACGEGFPGDALCGQVTVPLDRSKPAGATIDVAFELYPATDTSQPPVSTIVVAVDGPGVSTTFARDAWLGLFADARPRHDLLLVDRRGAGKSDAVDCPQLQALAGDLLEAIAACAAQLGSTADFYTSGDVADDVEAILAALAVDEIDYYAMAYGASEAIAYAVRHPARVRSLILASPYLPVEHDPFNATQVGGIMRAVEGFCRRSTPCSRLNRDPLRTLTALIARVRTAPVEGSAWGIDGRRKAVDIDEAALASILRNPDGDMLNQGEITAAARALQRGDEAPLLRLAAETLPIPEGASGGPPDEFASNGALTAAFCAEGATAWDKAASIEDRRAQFEAAVAGLPGSLFAPFSVDGWTGDWFEPFVGTFSLTGVATGYRTDPCIAWSAQQRANPVVPPGSAYPNVPALVLGSDTSIHTPREDAKAVAALFPQSRYLEVVGMDHLPALVEPCVAAIVLRFLEDLDPGANDCIPDPGGPWYAPGDFPERAAQAVAARVDPRGRNEATFRDRKIVAAAVGVVFDAYYHGGKLLGPVGHILRGGTFRLEFGESAAMFRYRNARFASDVVVDGSLSTSYEDGTSKGRIVVTGSALGGERAVLNVGGQFYNYDDAPFRVRGTIGGRRVAALVDLY
jgi:pimeloyl-ACP methyl ester carboxylesterase